MASWVSKKVLHVMYVGLKNKHSGNYNAAGSQSRNRTEHGTEWVLDLGQQTMFEIFCIEYTFEVMHGSSTHIRVSKKQGPQHALQNPCLTTGMPLCLNRTPELQKPFKHCVTAAFEYNKSQVLGVDACRAQQQTHLRSPTAGAPGPLHNVLVWRGPG